MEPLIGLEPMTVRLQGECSTSWAKVAFSIKRDIFYKKDYLSQTFFDFLIKVFFPKSP